MAAIKDKLRGHRGTHTIDIPAHGSQPQATPCAAAGKYVHAAALPDEHKDGFHLNSPRSYLFHSSVNSISFETDRK
jgi:hypothetical protein